MAEDTAVEAPAKPGPLGAVGAWWGDRPYTQLALIAAIFLIFAVLGTNLVDSMYRLGMQPGFGYLGQPAGFDIGEQMIPYAPGDTYGRAILVGLLNTIKVSFFGCLLATILGVALGIARLSGNLLLSRLVQAYVEVIRNTPLTLQLFFWIATTHALPPVRQALQPLPYVFLSIRGVFLPWIVVGDGSLWPLIGVLAALALVLTVVIRRRERPLPLAALLGLAALFPALAAAWIVVSGLSLTPDLPALHGFNITGGLTMTPEFAALLTGLTINSAASISEIVRSGIQSVGVGQWEAGRAVGLSRGRIMRLIVLPQAMRVITPLMTSSYLDLTKNSTLGVLIGYADLVTVINTSANNLGNAIETIIILVAVFLTLSLGVSALMNLYNARLIDRGLIAR
ncbi:amino acid ABC transporter permease [Labrys monachus]|uniref:General L-amino acid transport system permease protein n=1 Tax=Labrys monachus TaxID=217067 RepID=A0ABU0FJI7_9HYPH|nr:ABC transporter permease subunit [Labrys monachus]MDQ0394215.1 general L-amino acid transport system permease protein [Labrys monachus]